MAFADLIKQLFGDAPDDGMDGEARLRLAGAVLLLEIAKADFELDKRELASIEQALSDQFQLDPEDAAELLREARQEHADVTSLQPYVEALNRNLTRQDKRELLDGLWRVAHADGVLDAHEEHMMRRIADMLYLSHADYIQAKLKITGQ